MVPGSERFQATRVVWIPEPMTNFNDQCDFGMDLGIISWSCGLFLARELMLETSTKVTVDLQDM